MRPVSLFGSRVGVVAVAALFVAPAVARAQTTYTWNQPTTGGIWQTASNWSPNTGTPSVAGDIAVFGNVATGANSVTLSSGVTIGELHFDDANTGSLSAAYTIGSSSQTITLNNSSAAGLISVSGFTSANQTIAAKIAGAGTQPLAITNNGAAGVTTLTLSAALSTASSNTALTVSGQSNTTISGAIGGTIGTLTKSGTGELTLTVANAYTGGTVINGGVVNVSNDNQLGAAAGGVTLNGGALRLTDPGFASGRGFTLGANGGTILSNVGDGVATNPTISGVISGGGSLTVDGGGVGLAAGGYVALQGANTYTGPTIVNNAGLIVGSDLFGTHQGQLLNTTSILVNGYVGGQVGVFDVQNLLAPLNNRIPASAPITLNGGLFSFEVGLGSAVSEAFGNLTVKGFGTLFANQSSAGGSMAFATFSRQDNFTTLYAGGAMSAANIKVTFSGGMPSPGGSGTTIGIIPWIGGDMGPGGSGSGLASTVFSYSASTGLFALDTTKSDNFVLVANGDPFNGIFGDTAHNSITGSPAPVNSPTTILSLVQNTSSTTGSTITGTSTLIVSTGAIANANQLVFNGPTLDFGSATGYLWLGNVMGILGSSHITGSGGLVVSSDSLDGKNELRLQNTGANSFTGGLYINGSARVRFTGDDSQLGAAGQIISFRGGTLWYAGTSSISLSTSDTPRPLEMFAAGGGIVRVETAGTTLTIPGLISGTEQLTFTGPGTVALTNTANTYAGGTTIGDSIVGIAAPGSLGTGNITLGTMIGSNTFSGGTLRFDAPMTLSANINHALSSSLNTNGNDVTLTGVISGTGATLTKAGTGTLTLAGANTYTGSTVVSAGTVLTANSSGSATGYGAVTVNNGATLGGVGIIAGPVSVASGGTLLTGGSNGLGQLTGLSKTTLASGAFYQTTLAGTTAGTQFGQLIIKAGGAIDLASATFSPTLSYTPSSSDMLFILDNQNASGGLSGTFNGLANGATYTFGDGTTAQISYVGDLGTLSISGGNDVVLYNFVPVPEPGAVLGIAALGFGGLVLRRRR